MTTRTIRISVSLASLLLSSCQTGGFGRIDLDHDSLLNFDEFSAAPIGKGLRDPGAAFIAADSDRDGTLSTFEYQTYVGAYGGR